MDSPSDLRAFVRRWQVPLILLATALITGLAIAAYFLWIRVPYAVLFRDLRTADAATIVTSLDKRKVPYQLRDGGRAILVPEKLVDATRLAVMSEELPLKGVVGFELFNKSDMGLTEFAQRINYRRALQGEIARTIMGLDEVETARVHLSLSEPTVFRDDRQPSKASITIIPRAGRQIPPQSVLGIQRLAAAAVTDLDPADVVVLDARGDVISGALTSVASTSPSATTQEKAAIEAYYAGRVRRAIHTLVPQDQVSVVVAAGSLAAAAGAGDKDVFADWSPASRAFPLVLTVSSATPVGAEVKAAVRKVVAEAIGLDADLGDAVYFADVPLSAATPAPVAAPTPVAAPIDPAAPARAAHQPGGAASAASRLWVTLSLAALVVLGACAVLLYRHGRRAKRLTPRQRDAYAEQLRDLLADGDANALARR